MDNNLKWFNYLNLQHFTDSDLDHNLYHFVNKESFFVRVLNFTEVKNHFNCQLKRGKRSVFLSDCKIDFNCRLKMNLYVCFPISNQTDFLGFEYLNHSL